jgi:hypothetical protein
MTDLVLLTDAEISAVAGGAATQSVSVSVTQQRSSNVTTSVTATDAGGVTATAVRSLLTVGVGNINPADIAAVRHHHVFAALRIVHFRWC